MKHIINNIYSDTSDAAQVRDPGGHGALSVGARDAGGQERRLRGKQSKHYVYVYVYVYIYNIYIYIYICLSISLSLHIHLSLSIYIYISLYIYIYIYLSTYLYITLRGHLPGAHHAARLHLRADVAGAALAAPEPARGM